MNKPNFYQRLISFYRDKRQRLREYVLAPVVFKIMDIVGFKRHLPFSCTGTEAQELIYRKLQSGQPCMIGRIGASEIRTVEGTLHKNDPWWKKLKWRLTLHQTGVAAEYLKFFQSIDDNVNDEFFEKFADTVLDGIAQLDVFASWRWEETEVFPKDYQCDIISLWDLEPFMFPNPWTRALKGRKVLVIQPFANNIQAQYAHREKLFKNPDVLPEFQLQTYVPFFKGLRDNPGPKDWFGNLECMKKEIGELDFDVALIAAGPYGFPLAAHIKKMGRQAVVAGGVLQMFFGIKGARWDNVPAYNAFYNEYWIRPGENCKPAGYTRIDGGCYW